MGSADEDVGLLFCPVDSGRRPPTPGHCNVSGQKANVIINGPFHRLTM